MTLNGKVIWITGASSGIGKALVLACFKHGASVILSSRNESDLQSLVTTANIKHTDYLILPFDLSLSFDTQHLMKQIITKYNKIDILINNAGQSQRSLALNTNAEIEQKLFNINYFSQVALAKVVAQQMIQQRNGKIIVINSIAGNFGFYLRSSYSAAKHALKGYFESLRLELENENVSVLIVYPGKIFTNISKNAITASDAKNNNLLDDHTFGLSADVCVQKIITAIVKNKETIYIGGKELILLYLQRYIPFLFRYIVKKQKPNY